MLKQIVENSVSRCSLFSRFSEWALVASVMSLRFGNSKKFGNTKKFGNSKKFLEQMDCCCLCRDKSVPGVCMVREIV